LDQASPERGICDGSRTACLGANNVKLAQRQEQGPAKDQEPIEAIKHELGKLKDVISVEEILAKNFDKLWALIDDPNKPGT
jgi:hypothetical protein